MTDDLQALWQADDAPPPAPPPDLRAEAARLDRTLRRRDLRELGAAVVVAAAFGTAGLVVPRLLAPALGLVGVSVWIAAVIVGVRMAAPRASPWAPLREALAAEHRWLSAQVTLLRWAWLWYVLPVTVGLLAFDLALAGFRPVFPTLVVGGSVALGWANWKAAADLATTRDAFAAHLRSLSDD